MQPAVRELNILRLKDVIVKTGLSRSAIYKAINEGSFPKPIQLGTRSVGWLENELNDWIRVRVQKR